MVILLIAVLIFQVLMTFGTVFYVSETIRRDSNDPQIEQNTASNSTFGAV